ncbi:MAG: FAD-binding oxidoreductase [Saprospiraceae bacterium]|nr:FAD-binding oxidoreductase [Saprospiraceae bacterium]
MQIIHGWANYPKIEAEVRSADNPSQVFDAITGQSSIIARGNGRSYGDASLSELVFNTLPLSNIIQFDRNAGILQTESGVLLKKILDLIIPKGYFLPVVPGTKDITVGGAIAADVHGKNHPSAGSFSNFVIGFDLLDNTGKVIHCSPNENNSLFWNTCGGMGLTGIILRASLRLKKIDSSYLKLKRTPLVGLEHLLDQFYVHEDKGYSVAWIDALLHSKQPRSIFTFGQHLAPSELPGSLKKKPLQPISGSTFEIPFHCPSFFLNRNVLKVFNAVYFHSNKRSVRKEILHIDSFFFSLDTLGHWYRLYGKKGFLQYQFVLPHDQSLKGLNQIFRKVKASGEPAYLAVLKMLGPSHPDSSMSFPLPGFTLAMDFKASQKTFDLLNTLDKVLLDHGGRLYLAKDARMSPKTFRATYPKIVTRNSYFRSLLSDRLEI